jgi:hypothetical protein
MREDVLVKRIRRGEGAITKTGARPNGYVLPIIYELEDGREIEGHYQRARLRDAKAYEVTLPEIPDHEVRVMFRDGKFVGTQHKFQIGGPR